MLTIDRKYRDPWSGRLTIRFVILSNELPRFRDASAAIAHRMLILQMTQSFLGREDRTLDDRLRTELPEILNWALEGLDRLNRNGRFTVPRSSEDAASLMLDLASPMSAFVRERCVRDPQAEVYRDDLYAAWRGWAEDNGHQAGAKSTFGRNLRAVVPEVRNTKHRINGTEFRYYAHIGLAPVSPVSGRESAGHSPAPGAGNPAPECAPNSDSQAATGHPASNGATNAQVSGGETGETGTSPLLVQYEGRNGNEFVPPSGPGRCGECHWHVEKQGHSPGCPQTTEPTT
jgi:putative DNA primase/helicase